MMMFASFRHRPENTRNSCNSRLTGQWYVICIEISISGHGDVQGIVILLKQIAKGLMAALFFFPQVKEIGA
jgi:hypothetical protein